MAERDWFHPDDAPTHKSIIVSVPWPEGFPFVGEGFRDQDGTWRWVSDAPIDRPVVAWRHFPKPPEKQPYRMSTPTPPPTDPASPLSRGEEVA